MILLPKWLRRGCRLVGSDATASLRASLAAFIGDTVIELWETLGSLAGSSGACVCTHFGLVQFLLVTLEFMLSGSHTLKTHHCEQSEQYQNGWGFD